MAGKIVATTLQVNDSATAANNFVLKTDNAGGVKLSRGNDGATIQDILSVDAFGIITANVAFQAGFKNHIVNGGMQVAQGASVGVTAALQYGAVDMIQTSIVGGTGISGSILQGQTSAFVSGNYAGIGSASWTAGQVQFVHRIESKNCQDLNSKTITVSCKIFQDTGASRTIGFALRKANTIDNFGAITIINGGFGLTTVATSVTTPITSTITLGATDALNGLELIIYDSATNTIVNKNYLIGDLQLEIGAIATAFEYRDYASELIKCQRYYETSPYLFAVSPYTASSASNEMLFMWTFKVSKRVAPTVTYTGGAQTNQSFTVEGGTSQLATNPAVSILTTTTMTANARL